jgi:hypothetical protein
MQEHDKSTPFFMYLALHNVHQPVSTLAFSVLDPLPAANLISTAVPDEWHEEFAQPPFRSKRPWTL